MVLSAIGGRRAVHCDLGGLPNHPLNSWGEGRVLFHDLESLGKAIDAFKKDPAWSLLGDFTPILDDLDPFRDGRGGERMGSYIGWLVEKLDEGLDQKRAIQHANERYAEVWGMDKVVQPLNENNISNLR